MNNLWVTFCDIICNYIHVEKIVILFDILFAIPFAILFNALFRILFAILFVIIFAITIRILSINVGPLMGQQDSHRFYGVLFSNQPDLPELSQKELDPLRN